MKITVLLALSISLPVIAAPGKARAAFQYINQSDYRVRIRYKVIFTRHKLGTTSRHHQGRNWNIFYLNPGQIKYISDKRRSSWYGNGFINLLSKYKNTLVYVTRSGKNWYIRNNGNASKPNRVEFLHENAAKGNLINVKGVLKNGTNVNAGRNYFRISTDVPTALHYAVYNNRLATAQYLLDRGAWVNTRVKPKRGYLPNGRYGYELGGHETALNMAIYRNNPAMVELLMRKGARVSVQTNKGTALQYARKLRRRRLMHLLKGKPEKIVWGHVARREGLVMAAFQGNFKRIKGLLRRGANINKRNNQGKSALYMAAAKGHLHIVRYLVKKGADIHARNKDGDTALLFAAFKGHYRVVEYLYRKYARINLRGKYGDTALTVAAMKGHRKIVRFLVNGGADLSIRNKKGFTALAYAKKKGFGEIARILRKAARRVGYH